MPYDPFARARRASPQRRRSIRLRGYDYTQAGAYFITIVTCNRECLFGAVVGGEMRVNDVGKIVVECWDALPAHFANVELDTFVVMPNHVHGVVAIMDDGRGGIVRATHASPLRQSQRPRGPQPNSIGAIIGSFKSATTKRINQSRDTAGARMWQRNYYDHIIRNNKSWHAIRNYIAANPANWADDTENPIHIKTQETEMSTGFTISIPTDAPELRDELEEQLSKYARVSQAPRTMNLDELKLIVELVAGTSGILVNATALVTFLLMLKDRFKAQGKASNIRIAVPGQKDIALDGVDEAILKQLLGLDK